MKYLPHLKSASKTIEFLFYWKHTVFPFLERIYFGEISVAEIFLMKLEMKI